MKVKKHYENGAVVVYAQEERKDGLPSISFCLVFDNEQQLRRLGECLTDLSRIGGNEVEIKA